MTEKLVQPLPPVAQLPHKAGVAVKNCLQQQAGCHHQHRREQGRVSEEWQKRSTGQGYRDESMGIAVIAGISKVGSKPARLARRWRRQRQDVNTAEIHAAASIGALSLVAAIFTMSFARSFARNKPLNYFVAIV